jgi:hypothetical protein
MLFQHDPKSYGRLQTAPSRLLVDSVLPDFLFCSSTVCAGTQNCLHLLNASEENLSGDEPTDTFVTGRASQTALVGPELVEV